MDKIFYRRMFEGMGLYYEENGRSLLAVFSYDNDHLAIEQDEISFNQALQNDSASFVFSSTGESFDKTEADELLKRCKSALEEAEAKRGIIWASGPGNIIMPMSDDITWLQKSFAAPVSGTSGYGIDIKITAGAEFSIDEQNGLLVLKSAHKNRFSFGSFEQKKQIYSLSVSLCGYNAGKVIVSMDYDSTYSNIFNCGLEFGFNDDNSDNGDDGQTRLISGRIFDLAKIRDEIGEVTYEFGFGVLFGNTMRFQDYNKPIPCNFSSLYGDLAYLSPVPARNDKMNKKNGGGLSFLPRISENINAAPLGQYRVVLKNGGVASILCGFSGTEYVTLHDGDIIEFIPDCPAFSPYYPQKGFSMIDFVEPHSGSLFNADMTTSWVRFKGKYHSQPPEAPFFSGNGEVMPPADLYIDCLSYSPAMPIMPYGNILLYEHHSRWADKEDIKGFEQSIMACERSYRMSSYISDTGSRPMLNSGIYGSFFASTPSGFIGETKGGGFDKITIAYTPYGNLTFSDTTPEILSAFQSQSMFCVMACPDHIGKFENVFGAEDWRFKLSAGDESRFNSYANIIIIKGARGRLYDPENTSECLCGNPNRWTCAEFFSKPLEGEKANLANWISLYCKDAYDKYIDGDLYYKNFVGAITDENWRGFLALNVSLGAAAFPDCLKPLLAGLSDTSKIRAHHIGSDLVSVKSTEQGPVNDGFSPFFGLIRYKSEGFFGEAMPVFDIGADYEFKLLEMNVLFEKGAVSEFNSLSQLALNKFMSLKPSSGGCLYNALLLNGSLQRTDGRPVLMMNSNGGIYNFEGAPLLRAVINRITVISVNPDNMEFAFDIAGQVSFIKTSSNSSLNITPDIFSYENLPFSGYRINLVNGAFSLSLEGVSFNLDKADTRPSSFCKAFNAIPKAVLNGKGITKDYKAVTADNFRSVNLADDASGIEMSVILGGLGSLSDGSELAPKFIMAWDGGGGRFFGIKLPGSLLIDNVIGVTLGEARLKSQDGRLLLYISKTALQLMGMLKLPLSGSLNLAFSGGGGGDIGWFAGYNKKD